MTTALWLLAIQGLIGAFDTLYYHEWKARLPARTPTSAAELRLHAARDYLYAVLFAGLPWLEWHGLWVLALTAVLIVEIVLTLWDFVVEIAVRKSLGDVYAGERVTHAVMGIIYGAMIASLMTTLLDWSAQPTDLLASSDAPEALRWALSLMAAGVFLSGIRDLYAALGLPGGNWPWPPVVSGVHSCPPAESSIAWFSSRPAATTSPGASFPPSTPNGSFALPGCRC